MFKLQTKMLVSFVLLSCIMMSIMLFTFYHEVSPQIEKDFCDARLEVLNQTGSNIDNMTNMLLFAISSGPFQRQFRSILSADFTQMTDYDKLLLKKEVDTLFNNYSDTYQNLNISYYTILYGLNGFQYSNAESFDYHALSEASWLPEVEAADGNVVWISTHEDPFVTTSSKDIYIMARLLKTNTAALKPSGILAVVIDENSLYRTYSAGTDSSQVFIVNQEGQIVSCKDKTLIGTRYDSPLPLDELTRETAQISTGGGFATPRTLVTYQRLKSSGWWLVEATSQDTLSDYGRNLLIDIATVGVICLVGSIFITWLLSRHLSRPLNDLTDGMKSISQGNLDTRLKTTTNDEFHFLSNTFNNMADDICRLIAEVEKTSEEKRETEIRFLQTQINPHFVYNTLNSIRCFILMRDTENANQIMILMIRLMRSILNTKKIYVTLDEELESLNTYVEIQKTVYYNKLDIHFHIDPRVHMAKVPKLILQPIVENSIFHGITQEQIQGVIQVDACQQDKDLHITVTDNGIFSAEKRLELQQQLKSMEETPSHNGHHIALNNINCRLKKIYGRDYGLELLPECGKGTQIHLWIPLSESSADTQSEQTGRKDDENYV